MDDIEVLRQVRRVLESGWTQGAMARDAQGTSVIPEDDAACSWCLIGAISLVCGNAGITSYGTRDRLLSVLYLRGGLSFWNDWPHRTKDQVLDLIDRAIAAPRNV